MLLIHMSEYVQHFHLGTYDVEQCICLRSVETQVNASHVHCLCVQFWSLVPVDHLLARLELDSAVIARRLVQLLFNSYMPIDKPLDVQLSRAVQLVRSNHAAARKFFLYAYLHMSVFPTSQFCVFCWSFLS